MRRRFIVLAGVALLVACSEDTPARDALIGRDTVDATEVARIGQLDGASEYILGNVAAVAADGLGTIYVADQFGSTLGAYDSTGSYLATIAAEGEGSGELSFPRDLVFGPRGTGL